MLNQLISWQSLLDLAWLLLLLLMLGHFWRDRKSLMRTRSWSIAKGRITALDWTRERHRLWPRIQYTYQVLEEDFYGEHLFHDTAHYNPNSKYARKVAYKAAMAYENDAEIDVFYNPNNPQEAVLDITIPQKLNLIIALLLVLIIVHVAVVIVRLW